MMARPKGVECLYLENVLHYRRSFNFEPEGNEIKIKQINILLLINKGVKSQTKLPNYMEYKQTICI